MIYIKVVDGSVVDRALFEGAMPDNWPERNLWHHNEEAQIGWVANGSGGAGPYLPLPPEPSSPPSVLDYENAIQEIVDNTAREKKFRDGVTMASYAASTNPQWAAEAQAFVAWRDAIWLYAYAELDKVMSGERPQPTIEEFLNELEPIVWPET